MLYCSVCNILHSPGSRYCKRCKTHLSYLPSDSENEFQLKCPVCGELTSIESGNCMFCNASLYADNRMAIETSQADTTIDESPKINSKKKKKKTTSSAPKKNEKQSPM